MDNIQSVHKWLYVWLAGKLGVGEWEWGMGSEYQLFFLGHPMTLFKAE